MLFKPVEALRFNHKSVTTPARYLTDGPLGTGLCGNYSSSMLNKSEERKTANLTKIVVLRLVLKVRSVEFDKVHTGLLFKVMI